MDYYSFIAKKVLEGHNIEWLRNIRSQCLSQGEFEGRVKLEEENIKWLKSMSQKHSFRTVDLSDMNVVIDGDIVIGKYPKI